MKNSNLVEQLEHDPIHRAKSFILAHSAIFARQGSVVEDYRTRNHRRFGPYYRLTFRHLGRQKSLYLGSSAAGVQEIRCILDDLQRITHARRDSLCLRTQIKRSLRRQKWILQKELSAYGYYLNGFQIHSSIKKNLPGVRLLLK